MKRQWLKNKKLDGVPPRFVSFASLKSFSVNESERIYTPIIDLYQMNEYYIPKNLKIKSLNDNLVLAILPETTNWAILTLDGFLSDFLIKNFGNRMQDNELSEEQKEFLEELYNLNLILKNNLHKQLKDKWFLFYKEYWSKKLIKDYPHVFAILDITTRCNLNCTYCYIPEKLRTKEDMDFKTGVKIINLIYDLIKKGKKEKATIQFHGGEPILNNDVLIDLIKYILSSDELRGSIGIVIQTNGTLLYKHEKLIKLLRENNEYIGLSISIDPPRKIHNFYRPFKTGEGSFDEIIKTIKRLRKENIAFGVCTVITPHIKNHIPATLGFFEDNDLKNVNFITLVKNNNLTITSEEEHYILKTLYDYQLTNGFRFNIPYIESILKNLFTFLRFDRCFSNPCGAGNSVYTFFPNGDIYPCDSLSADPNYYLGNVHELTELPVKIYQKGIDVCQSCEYMNLDCGAQFCTDFKKNCNTIKKTYDYIFNSFSNPDTFRKVYTHVNEKLSINKVKEV